jgi:Integrase core domain
MTKWTPLAPLPILECPNIRIHADLFGPMITADSNKKIVLCFTDAFTKYAVVTAIASKDAEKVADAIYRDRFSKFGIRAQIHMDGGKEFVNKLSVEHFQLLNVSHTKTSPAHPQWKCLTKQLKSICNLSWTIQSLTGKHFYQHWP